MKNHFFRSTRPDSAPKKRPKKIGCMAYISHVMERSIIIYGVFLILTMFILVSLPESSNGHRIHLDVISQTVEVEAYYGDGKPIRNGTITVYRENGDILLRGTTDNDGKFSFRVDEEVSGTLTIEIEQTGHRAEVEIGSHVQRDGNDFPMVYRMIAGFGYLVGLAGISSLYTVWKMKKKMKEGGRE